MTCRLYQTFLNCGSSKKPIIVSIQKVDRLSEKNNATAHDSTAAEVEMKRAAAEEEAEVVGIAAASIAAFSMAGASISCAPLSTDVDNLKIPDGRFAPRVRPDSVTLTDTPLDIATPVVMMISVLVDVETEAEPVQDDTLQVTEAVQMK